MAGYFKMFVSVYRKDAVLRRSTLKNIVRLFMRLSRVYFSRRFDKLIIINMTEHIGDIVACEPIAFHLRKLNPRSYIIWSVNNQYYQLIEHNPHINEVIKLTCLTEWILLKKLFTHLSKIYDLHLNGKRCSKHSITSRNSVNQEINFNNYLDHGSLLHVASMVAGITDMPEYAPRFHFDTKRECSQIIKGKYIVFHSLSNEADRNWDDQKWNDLYQKLLSEYPDMQIAEIGLKNVIRGEDKQYHDLTGKLDFQEIAYLIRSATMFIGVESGFAHIANSFNKKSVIMIGHFQPFKNYMVYSGHFAEEGNSSLLYHEGLLKDLEMERVLGEVRTVLGSWKV